MLVTGFLVTVLAGVFAVSVKAFRARTPEPQAISIASTAPIATPTSITPSIPESARQDREAALVDVRSSVRVGVARRGQEDGKPYVELVMSPLAIDRESQAYEAWLLRQVPYEFFSLGEMVTNDLGEFVVRWEGGKDGTVDDYTRVVVTLEKKDGNPDPGEQVIKGTFGAD